MITKDLGAVSAYAYAVEKGYTGTEAEYAELMASYATVAQQAGESAQTASEKAQQASASATSASQSASSASASAQTAQTAQQTASTKASEAQQSAQTATTKAQEASQSASESSQSAQTAVQAKQDAQTAKTASETAQASAESARDDAESARDEAQQIVSGISGKVEQIVQNTADIASLEADRYKAYVTDTATGAVASFSDGADGIPLKSLVVDINPVQDLSHGDPSPENICPISGWTEVDVEQSGVNVFGGTFVNMAIASLTSDEMLIDNASYRGFYVRVKGGQTYTVSRTSIETNRFRIGATVDEPAPNVSINALSNIMANDSEYSITVTIPDGYNYIFVYLSNQSDTCTANNYQIELGSTATPYSPYTGRSITIQLGQTVYGGKLDVLSGVLTVDRANIASYNGETLPSTWISDRDAYAQGATPTTGAQVVYELATPITYQLTPQQVSSLYGVNNIWADSGDTEVEYRANTKLWVQKKITEAVAAALNS